MEAYYVKKVGNNRGSPRVWLDGSSTERAGFTPGQRYDIDVQGSMIVLQANKDGSRVVSGKVAGEKNNPIIDINSKALLAMFDGMAAIRVVVKKDQIYLMPLASEVKKKERFGRLKHKLENGEPLDIGSISHGGGILSHAVHSGLTEAGVDSRLAFANEIRGELLEHANVHNDAWDDHTQLLAAPMQELAFDTRAMASLPKVEIMELGIPCSGNSKAGKSKRGLVHAEAHPHVGHLIVPALVMLNRCNPSIVVFENVPSYQTSASADILRNYFRENGYNVQERILKGRDFGAKENRDRWCLLAADERIEIDFDQLVPPGEDLSLLAEVLDDVPLDDPRWRNFDYLKSKEVRDELKGNGFGMQIYSEASTHTNVMRKGYAKGGSSDPLLSHPADPTLLRQFTPAEHARLKGIPAHLIEGLSTQVAHEVLGQSIVHAPFKAVGHLVGNSLNRLVGRDVFENEADTERRVIAMSRTASTAAEQTESVVAVAAKQSPQQQLGFDDPVVYAGEFSGMILRVADGIATQKINRAGQTAQHQVVNLSSLVAEGQVVNIKYQGGKGAVSGPGISSGLER